jgi:MATE family multidrug resistance protein
LTIADRIAAPPPSAPGPARWLVELKALLLLGGPLVAAQLSTVALTATDVLMMGWLGPQQLAGGALGTALLHPFHMMGTGFGVAVAPLVAQALGAGRRREARRSLRQGLWVALAAAAVIMAILTQAETLLLWSGQTPDLARLSAVYLSAAIWMMPPALCFVALRSFLSAHGETRIVMGVALAGVAVNALGNYALMFGHFGLPRLELLGAGVSTALTHLTMAALIALYVARRRRFRLRYAPFARFHRADWPRFFAIVRMGAPIGVTLMAESLMFSGVALLMGWLGPDALAAHAVALQLASIAFMTPLGLSMATTVRVGLSVGARDGRGAARAAWVSLAATVGFMAAMAALFVGAPQTLVGLFLDPADPASTAAFTLAVSYLGIAALFQTFDGMQVSAAGALRGYGDVWPPMAIAVTCYALVGLPAAWALGFPMGLEGIGVWLGLAAGLLAAAVMLIARLAARSRAETLRAETAQTGRRRGRSA